MLQSLPVKNIHLLLIVWRIRAKIIRTAVCCIVTSYVHTDTSCSYRWTNLFLFLRLRFLFYFHFWICLLLQMQLIDGKDLSLTSSVACWLGRKTLLTHAMFHMYAVHLRSKLLMLLHGMEFSTCDWCVAVPSRGWIHGLRHDWLHTASTRGCNVCC